MLVKHCRRHSSGERRSETSGGKEEATKAGQPCWPSRRAIGSRSVHPLARLAHSTARGTGCTRLQHADNLDPHTGSLAHALARQLAPTPPRPVPHQQTRRRSPAAMALKFMSTRQAVATLKGAHSRPPALHEVCEDKGDEVHLIRCERVGRDGWGQPAGAYAAGCEVRQL